MDMDFWFQFGYWWFDHNNGKRYGYDMSNQMIFEEWYDYDNNYHNRFWTIGEFYYSHSDRTKINNLLQYLTSKVEITNE